MTEDQEEKQDIEMIPDEETGGQNAENKVKKLRDELKKCEAEKKEYLDGWQRTKAEHINYRKDEAKRFEEMAKFAAEGLIAEVVQVLDSFDLALRHEMPKEVEKGVVLIRSQLEDILRRRGLEVISALGQRFDPALHEAIGEVESDKEEGVVAEELQKGYLINGRVVRPARVKIYRKKLVST
ncbi:MAG: nucleotide exchange factor GrpE [Candidatus Sungbacteria bacterium]|nr:nucleotide exchange factor GrpE [Candidatus Sungbacteria bacterium]